MNSSRFSGRDGAWLHAVKPNHSVYVWRGLLADGDCDASIASMVVILLNSAAVAEKRVALLIGNGAYARVSKLSQAEDLEDALCASRALVYPLLGQRVR